MFSERTRNAADWLATAAVALLLVVVGAMTLKTVLKSEPVEAPRYSMYNDCLRIVFNAGGKLMDAETMCSHHKANERK